MQDVLRRVDVAVGRVAAVGAPMHPHRQSLGGIAPARAALLTGAAWIHLDLLSASTRSLARNDRSELSPPGVVYVLGQHPAGQALDVQILHRDKVVFLDQCLRRLEVKVLAHALHLEVFLGQNLARFAASLRAALLPRHPPLRALQLEPGPP